MNKKRELGIYVHIPFCIKKCNYCDFLSAPATKQVQKYYVDGLTKQIKQYKELIREYEVKTIFFGGGTPSALEIKELKRIMEQLEEFINDEQEITIEANPGTLTKEKLMFYKKSGFNRLSIGLQSANERELKLLGRIHTYEDFLQNYIDARESGFENINIDLMSALPGQTKDTYKESLKKVLMLNPEHISAYSLIIEEGTKFYDWYNGREDLLPDEDTERDMYYFTKEYLKEKGYQRYEISNYAKKGFESRHNLSYWSGTDYLGLGLGASSLIKGNRFRMESDLEKFCQGALEENNLERDKMELTRREQMEEFMFLGLRKIEGIDENEFYNRFQVTMEEVYGSVLKKLTDEKLIEKMKNKIFLTKYGIDVSNIVLSEFLLSE